jgi:hypothetical protein
MKNTLKALGLLVVAASLITCDALEEADDVTFHADMTIVFITNEDGDGTNVPYDDVQLLDLADNAEIADYLDRIKDIKIDSITYRITNYDASPHGEAVIFNNGTASFGPFDSDAQVLTVDYAASASGVNLQTTVTETTLDIDQDQFNTVIDLLLDDKKVKMYSEGELSKTPIAFNIVSKWYFTITANALN